MCVCARGKTKEGGKGGDGGGDGGGGGGGGADREEEEGQSRGTACGGAECGPEKEGDVEDGEREGRERRNREKESERVRERETGGMRARARTAQSISRACSPVCARWVATTSALVPAQAAGGGEEER